MRVLVIALALAAALLAGCTARTGTDAAAACAAQGHAPGTEAYRACMDAGGVPLATGPGSPYMNADEEKDLF